MKGKEKKEEEEKNNYSEEEVFGIFKKLMKSELDAPEFETEEAKKEKFPEHGMELWGIGYVSSDHEPDDDEEDMEEEGDEALENETIREKIFSGN